MSFYQKKGIIRRYLKESRDILAQKVKLKTDYITLGQLLKIVDIISSGGQAKWFLQENDVLINGELDNRRGRKLYPNDLVEIPEYGKFMMEADK